MSADEGMSIELDSKGQSRETRKTNMKSCDTLKLRMAGVL
jgi:hypothetical protein